MKRFHGADSEVERSCESCGDELQPEDAGPICRRCAEDETNAEFRRVIESDGTLREMFGL